MTVDNIQITPEERRRVVRKLDLHLLPLCFILYTFSVLDRSNLGNAKLAGLAEDINISGDKYTWLANLFYIAYIIFQFSNLGWKIFKPHKWVTFVVLYWGIVSTLQAVCTSWQGLMACRFFLGWAETMFGPGIPLYFSFFYPPEYLGLRFGIFLSGSALANAYGGALAYALSHIHSSVANWKFLFIIEGVPTVLLAVATWFFLPDSPEKARFLNERERLVAEAFAQNQPGDFEHEGLQVSQLMDAFKDYRNYFFALLNFSCNVSFASLPLFLPTIISELGTFSQLESNGLSAPPYLLCFFVIIATAIVSDRVRLRGPFASFFALLAAIGFIILGTATSVTARYVGIFLTVNIFVTTTIILIWNSNINATGSKRAGGLWIMMTVGQCGTLLGTNIFPSSERPFYRKGMWIACSFSLLAAVASAVLSTLLFLENRRRDRKYGRLGIARRLKFGKC
ncbi:MFS general substrate transporter [Mollisia scopiformis]|uniref:MFS general substrate transporter n=1 Tax=Mollisia scopiformis TaxID=149040 RepID=A0A194XQ58_MOLSC|nr:MFS general substrate transporter [Mollisia scopiformis]KUJ22189.1 MFS general substrate transporter [Mollisia scopiformis]